MSKRKQSNDSDTEVESTSVSNAQDENINNNNNIQHEFVERNTKKQKVDDLQPIASVSEPPSLSAEQLQKIEKSRAMAMERLRVSKRKQLLGSLTSNLHDSWKSVVEPEFEKDYFNSLLQFLLGEKETGKEIFPPEDCVMEAFRTDFNNLKVVIIGQEIESDLKIKLKKKNNGCLLNWSTQGVLLLNTCLTVQARTAGSHSKKGWETFTSAVIDHLCKTHKDLVFLLWGKYAQSFSSTIERAKRNHIVLTANHPSPLSASKGFMGCRHFSKANAVLERLNKTPIDWDPSNSH